MMAIIHNAKPAEGSSSNMFARSPMFTTVCFVLHSCSLEALQ